MGQLSIQKEEAKKKEVHVEENVPAPSPRSNCSLNINPLKETELILYGGEFYNGSKTFVYGDLYRYDVEKQEWKLVSSPNSPPPRSAHQAVAWKNYLYIFGGEFTSPNQERFHHYKASPFFLLINLSSEEEFIADDLGFCCLQSSHTHDFWVLDLKTNSWEQLNYKGCPSPRSGHRMVLYKHKIVVFGGFYDTLREVRYFNDLHIFDLDHFKWQEIKPTPGCMWPSARSGFQLFVHQDEIFLYGGYSKEVSSEKSDSEKGIVHSDMWSLDPRTWEWNKVKKIGMPPGPRAGFSMCVHKKRALLFGGVVDMEVKGDVIMSLFLNELYGFQLDNRRWYPLELRKEKSTKNKLKKSSGEEANTAALNNKITPMEVEKSVTNDKDGDLEYLEEVDVESSIDDISLDIERNMTVDGLGIATTSDGRPPECSSKYPLQSSPLPEVVKPCGRINSCTVVGRDTLYIYGGMMEVKDREIALDDLYALNLSKLDEWKCIIPASESEWIEASEGEDEEDEEDSEQEESGSGDDDDDDETDDDDNDDDDGKSGPSSLELGDAVALIKGEGKNLRRKDKRARIEQIRVSLGLSDSQRTPMPGETLKDFYKRTNMYWQMAAYEHTQHTGKELRKDGFDLAVSRYKELKPILDELAILEAEQKAEEEEGPESSSLKKRGNKKNKHLASK
ncbi:hypothetical protein RHGRI_024521 [Rhododendron griersonianum]|uniref:DUF4110 domain-containing protein n=1 Tax=Rhododendron griersonianum TaxID=479676 RepID=A0AAV6J7G1_9ERIC|nr:hypothetical protein RHGRI_024521 [Rhododendron griersonianum]